MKQGIWRARHRRAARPRDYFCLPCLLISTKYTLQLRLSRMSFVLQVFGHKPKNWTENYWSYFQTLWTMNICINICPSTSGSCEIVHQIFGNFDPLVDEKENHKSHQIDMRILPFLAWLKRFNQRSQRLKHSLLCCVNKMKEAAAISREDVSVPSLSCNISCWSAWWCVWL